MRTRDALSHLCKDLESLKSLDMGHPLLCRIFLFDDSFCDLFGLGLVLDMVMAVAFAFQRMVPFATFGLLLFV